MGVLEAMSPRKKVYLAGPMTGIPDDNFPAFFAAEEELREKGYDVLNPAIFGHEGTWVENMKRDIPLLIGCDMVACLPGWAGSRGACFEVEVATRLRIPRAYRLEDLPDVRG